MQTCNFYPIFFVYTYLVYTRNFAKVIKTLCARLADCCHTRYVWYIYAQGIKWKIVEDTWPGIYTRVSTIAFRRNADGISSFRSRRVAWRERKQLREDARRRKLAVLLASRRGADRWREGRKKFSACSSLGEEVDRGDGWKKRRGFREDSSGRGTLVEDVLLFRMVEIYVEILSLGRSCLS